MGQKKEVGAKDGLARFPKSPTWAWSCIYNISDLLLIVSFRTFLLAVVELLSEQVAVKLYKCEVNVPKEADVLVLRINLFVCYLDILFLV